MLIMCVASICTLNSLESSDCTHPNIFNSLEELKVVKPAKESSLMEFILQILIWG